MILTDPFPHVVIDGFFSDEELRAAAESFPNKYWPGWFQFANDKEKKYACLRANLIPEPAMKILERMNGPEFVKNVEQLMEIERPLIADPEMWGGGMHMIKTGGRLAVHADFNKQPTTGLDRRVNVLLYLNDGWQEEWGGHLELWNEKECVKKILPVLNRMVIFKTSKTSFHGHPHPLTCPEDRFRKSLALYYYTDGRPEVVEPHGTIFKGDS